ncbi:MAG: sulfatase [Planctomycetota bacterium]|nr:sulfatase [Planctomycetota bacterium]
MARLSLPLALGALGVLSALAALLLPACGTDEPQERPRNVILFLVDTLRADRLGCYGYGRDTSPSIDRLAARGTLYEGNYSQGCWTIPSMISMMSGLYVFAEEERLPEKYPVLAEVVQTTSRLTAGFAGNLNLTHDRGFERGFDHFEGIPGGKCSAVVDRFVAWYGREREDIAAGPGFFAWIHSTDPHSRYAPDEEFRKFKGQRRLDQEKLVPMWREQEDRAEELALEGAPKLRDAIQWMTTHSNLYDGEVLAVDAAFQRLVAFLEEQGELEDTLIVFASDHGEILWEQPHYPLEVQLRIEREGGLEQGVANLFAVGHRAWFYEPLWNTPLIISGPGMPADARPGGLAANLDIYPTILHALGLEIPEWLPGESLWGGREPTRERVFGYGFNTTAVLDKSGLKLIEHMPRRYLLEEDAEQPLELLDLNADPDEWKDVAEERPADAARLKQAIAEWRAAVTREYSTEVSRRALDDLKKMGYVGDDGPQPDGEE